MGGEHRKIDENCKDHKSTPVLRLHMTTDIFIEGKM
jgi:hypothetical protein